MTLYPPPLLPFLRSASVPLWILASARSYRLERNGARSMHAKRRRNSRSPTTSRTPSRSPPTVSTSSPLNHAPLKKPIITCRRAATHRSTSLLRSTIMLDNFFSSISFDTRHSLMIHSMEIESGSVLSDDLRNSFPFLFPRITQSVSWIPRNVF